MQQKPSAVLFNAVYGDFFIKKTATNNFSRKRCVALLNALRENELRSIGRRGEEAQHSTEEEKKHFNFQFAVKFIFLPNSNVQ